MSDSYTLDEVAKHNTRDDLWVAVAGSVYDVRCSLCISLLHSSSEGLGALFFAKRSSSSCSCFCHCPCCCSCRFSFFY